jgi:hypothetical protein
VDHFECIGYYVVLFAKSSKRCEYSVVHILGQNYLVEGVFGFHRWFDQLLFVGRLERSLGLGMRISSLVEFERLVLIEFIFLVRNDVVHFLLPTSFVKQHKEFLVETDQVRGDGLFSADLHIESWHS